MTKLTIAFAADHAGYELKQQLIEFAQSKGYETLDFGTDSTESCDYPVMVPPVVDALRSKAADFGVLVCGSGVGVDIVANRHRGMRSALCHNPEHAETARRHNDANILSLGARFISLEDAQDCLLKFLTTSASQEERHARRIAMIDRYM